MFNAHSSQGDIHGLLLAAVRGDIPSIKRYLERRQVPVDITYYGKPSALGYAAMRGHLTVVDYLLLHRADVNFSDLLGQTPLIYATLGNYPAIIGTLLSHGADLYHQNELGDTALTLALKHPTLYACAEVLSQPEAAFFQPLQGYMH